MPRKTISDTDEANLEINQSCTQTRHSQGSPPASWRKRPTQGQPDLLLPNLGANCKHPQIYTASSRPRASLFSNLGLRSEASLIYSRHLFLAGIPLHGAQWPSLPSLSSSLSLWTSPLIPTCSPSIFLKGSLLASHYRTEGNCFITPGQGAWQILPNTWFKCGQGRRTRPFQPPENQRMAGEVAPPQAILHLL